MNVKIEDFNLRYKQKILQLHKISFEQTRSGKYWDWRFNNKFLKNPFGKIAFFKKKIISHFIVQPVKYKIITHH